MLKGKKNKCLLVLLPILIFVFAACGGDSAQDEQVDTPVTPAAEVPADTSDYEPAEDEQQPEEEPEDEEPEEEEPEEEEPEVLATGITRGIWNDNVWTSEYLGITVTLEDNWLYATDEEIAALMGIGSDALAAQGLELDFELATLATFHDMLASNTATGASIQVLIERLFFPHNRMTAEQYIEAAAETLEMMGMQVNLDFPGVTRIGNYDWLSYGSVMEVMGVEISARYFVNVKDGFARIIMMVYSEASETPEEILQMFN
jgi:hypothetical protein